MYIGSKYQHTKFMNIHDSCYLYIGKEEDCNTDAEIEYIKLFGTENLMLIVENVTIDKNSYCYTINRYMFKATNDRYIIETFPLNMRT